MSIRRTASAGDRVTVLQRAALQDRRLSYRARGVLAVVLSRPLHWRTSAVDLANEGTEGEHAIRAALRELERYGYLRRARHQVEGGRWVTSWDISDDPGNVQVSDIRAGHTERRLPPLGPPTAGEPPLIEDLDTGTRENSSSPASRVPHQRPIGLARREGTDHPGGRALDRHGHPKHDHEVHAKKALTAIRRERRLGVEVALLLGEAYRIGHGDPWQGYKEIAAATAEHMDSAWSRSGATLDRIRRLGPQRADETPDWLLEDPA